MTDLLDVVMRSVADGLYLVDGEGVVQMVNPAALRILGYDDEDELLGRPSHATIHGTRPDGSPFPEAQCPLLAPRRTGETVRVEEDWFVRRDGSHVPVAYSSAPAPVGGGRGAIVVFHDTSDRRLAEAEARAEALQASRARMVAAADAERARLGRDLHDGAQQRLVHVALTAQQARDRLAADPARADALLGEVVAETRTSIAELRELSHGIHPAILTARGLPGALEGLALRSAVPTTLAVPPARHDPAIEATVFFAVAEALANTAKHAAATAADVFVGIEEDELTLDVRDDGRGGADPHGHGLRGLEDRFGALGGSLVVDSPPGAGTHLRGRLPLR